MVQHDKVALVVGARGVIGGNLIDHLESTGEWKIIGLSRRGGTDADRVEHIAVDLLDPSQTAAALSGLDDVTHVFYAAYQDRPTWAELVPPNLAMLVNTLDAIEPVAGGLEHVSLMQGYKVYGAHLGPFKTPASRERSTAHATRVQRRPTAVPRTSAARQVVDMVGDQTLGRLRIRTG